ncbi:MAG: hypothetical protein MAG451_02451 [Anaerolineales bacterium]|nr:hypothetical protein [Anaerolineales bacterium]
MMGLLDRLLRCGEHQFPMVRIGLNYVCTAEYLDEVIGHRRLTEVSQDTDGVLYLQFGPERWLPLFCPCCGEASVTGDLDAFKQRWCGRRVEGFTTYQERAEGDTWDVIEIFFSGREPEEDRTLPIGIKSVQQLEIAED